MPFDIAIDQEHDHVYWTDRSSSTGRIMRCNLDGSNQSVLETDLYTPLSISLDNGYDTLYIDI
jgi:hypothetical protein